MAVGRSSILASCRTCLRVYRSSKLFSLSRPVLQPCLREMSYALRASNIINSPKRLCQYTQVAKYYVKAKERKGPSLRSWFAFGAACIASATGAVLFLGKLSIMHVATKISLMFCTHIIHIVLYQRQERSSHWHNYS